MAEAKRRRSGSVSSHNTRKCEENHVYDEATDTSSSARAALFTEVRASWMREVRWASEADLEAVDGSITQEILSLNQQLSQVKRRLGPAAERSTESSNSHHNSPKKTTGAREFVSARRACNPYESLGEGRNGGLNSLFMNRSAVKLANIDAMLDFVVSRPIEEDGSFSFVDLCAAPGGFSEYLGYRCHSNGRKVIRGYGMSLLSRNEYGKGTPWQMQDSAGTEEGAYSQYKVCRGHDGTGDILNWNNVLALQALVRSDSQMFRPTSDGGHVVDLVVADGGFDAQRNSDRQEALAQKLVLCEGSAGLLLLKPGGTLLMKMFGFQTEIIRSMMKDIFLLFADVIAVKPISSRPASAERYVVCRGFHGLPPHWDGQQWMNRILLGRTTFCGGDYDRQTQLKAFMGYLDKFDHAMASLNLKTCFSILSFLENKCLMINCPTYDGSEHNDDNEEDAPLIDIEAYKVAWRLI